MNSYFKVIIVMPHYGINFDNAIRARVNTLGEAKSLVSKYLRLGALSFSISKVTIEYLKDIVL